MKEKYLPIGTIIVRKGNNKKYMITGYSPVIYNGKLNTYDYSSCPYPEGLLLKNQDAYFNHDEIEKIEFLGYEGMEYKQFLKSFILDEEAVNNKIEADNNFRNIQFDENGIVVFDGVTNSDTSNELKDIQFDENGFVISISNDKTTNPFVTPIEFEANKDPEENKDMSIFKNYKFDENGFVVSDGNETVVEIVDDKQEEVTNSGIKFDENGFVIEDLTNKSSETSNIQFDENGFVISE